MTECLNNPLNENLDLYLKLEIIKIMQINAFANKYILIPILVLVLTIIMSVSLKSTYLQVFIKLPR